MSVTVTATPNSPSISLVPRALNLALYAGDGAVLKLSVTDSANQPLVVTGTVTAQIRATRLGSIVLATFAADLVEGDLGIIALSLTSAETAALIVPGETKFAGVWDCQWEEPPAEPITLVQGSVTCILDVTRP